MTARWLAAALALMAGAACAQDYPFGGQVRYAPPEEFARFIRAEYDRWGPVVRQAGVKVGD